jgi:hypothetical protein
MKFFGTSFLSRPSALVLDRAKAGPLEARVTMQVPQVLLALACLLFGLVPFLGTGLIQGALDASPMGLGAVLAGARPAEAGSPAALPAAGGQAILAPLVLAATLGLLLAFSWWIGGLGGASRREAEPWLCGHVRDGEAYRYRAHSWYHEAKRYLAWVGGDAHAPPEGPVSKDESPGKKV